ncbi:hypothetical protein HYW46_07385 [Candidatus Daviesbacteria bacterium]|nr:hypothetical protein [Candidatus Daviesbacteria bacterium]
MSQNEQEPSWGDLVEQWLKTKKAEQDDPNKRATTSFEKLLEENPDITVFRDREEDVHIWVDLTNGGKRLISVSRRVRNSYNTDIILVSQHININGKSVPEYTHLTAQPESPDVIHIKGYTTETDLDLQFLLNKTKVGLEILKASNNTPPADQKRLWERTADYCETADNVKEFILNTMLRFVDVYIENSKK